MQQPGALKHSNFYSKTFFHQKKKIFILTQKEHFSNEKLDFWSKGKMSYAYLKNTFPYKETSSPKTPQFFCPNKTFHILTPQNNNFFKSKKPIFESKKKVFILSTCLYIPSKEISTQRKKCLYNQKANFIIFSNKKTFCAILKEPIFYLINLLE